LKRPDFKKFSFELANTQNDIYATLEIALKQPVLPKKTPESVKFIYDLFGVIKQKRSLVFEFFMQKQK